MWHLLLLLPAFFSDYRIIREIAHCALTAGVATVSVLGSISVSLVIRYSRAAATDRSPESFPRKGRHSSRMPD